MAMIEIKSDPSRRELNWFGLLMALFFAIVGAILLWQFDAQATAFVLWIVAAALTILYYVIPPIRRPMYLAWMYAAFPLGWVISHVLMAVIYYLVFTPTGLIMRIVGYDPMHRKFDPDAPTYWVEHKPGGDPERYFRQF